VAAFRIKQEDAIRQQVLLYVERVNCGNHIVVLKSYQSAFVINIDALIPTGIRLIRGNITH
jgi:hypothetical protein